MNWMRYRPIYFVISSLVLIPGIWSLLTNGFKLAVDFTGGSAVTFETNPPGLEDNLKQIWPGAEFRTESDKLVVQTPPLTQAELDKASQTLGEKNISVKVLSFVSVGPSAGSLLLRQTLLAAAIATLGILAYVSSAFKSIKYGLCAVLAMFHDTLVLLGSFSLLGHFLGVQVDLLFVTALLTTLSFSVHDTIVLFDRTRELSRKTTPAGFNPLANRAITDTMIRSLNNSMTIVFMLLALVLMGGDTIRWFAVALLIGALTGTYSSPFVAIPLLSLWNQLEARSKKSF